jgi:3-hydroxyisobutyrate dehydrogenase-like beta-hydroxyacid dehydrogenase
MSSMNIGFIGFGEVGSTFSGVFVEHDIKVRIYDVLQEESKGEEIIRSRIPSPEIELTQLSDLVESSDVIFSTVTTQVALDVAISVEKHLSPNKTYIDLNSTSPVVKRDIGKIIDRAGAEYIEGAILGAVGASGESTRILLSGHTAKEVATILKSSGLNTTFFSQEIGKASQFKMLRSIFSKGVEALLLEMMVAGYRAEIDQELWRDINSFMDSHPFEDIASNWISSHGVAYERRYFEMIQVVETVQDLGVNPLMSSATVSLFKRSMDTELGNYFKKKPDNHMKVIAQFSNITK